jgi:type VI secretion system protein ImpA
MTMIPTRSSFIPVEDLLKPIPGETPVGVWLRYDPIYDQIREARRFEDPDLSQGIWEHELKVADWTVVEKLCCQALVEKTKDLQIAAWLVEAWIALDEFDGFIRGLNLIQSLSQQFWPALFPQIDNEGDIEHRLRILEWLDDSFTERLIRIPLTDIEAGEVGYHLADWMAASRLDAVAKRSPDGTKLIQSAENQNQVTLSKFLQAFSLTSPEKLKTQKESILAAEQTLLTFKKTMNEIIPDQVPSYKTLLNRLDDLKRLSQLNSSPSSQDSETASLSPSFSMTAPEDSSEIEVKNIVTRQAAYQQLKQIASFLEAIEPHSPAPHLLKRITSWENKTLAEIFAEFGDSPQDLSLLARLIGRPQ